MGMRVSPPFSCEAVACWIICRPGNLAHEPSRYAPLHMRTISVRSPAMLLAINAVFVSVVQLRLHEAAIAMSQALSDGLQTDLLLKIITTVALHVALLSLIPMTLSFFGWRKTSYMSLLILLAMYVEFASGIELTGFAITLVLLAILAWFAVSKARDLYHYLRRQ